MWNPCRPVPSLYHLDSISLKTPVHSATSRESNTLDHQDRWQQGLQTIRKFRHVRKQHPQGICKNESSIRTSVQCTRPFSKQNQTNYASLVLLGVLVWKIIFVDPGALTYGQAGLGSSVRAVSMGLNSRSNKDKIPVNILNITCQLMFSPTHFRFPDGKQDSHAVTIVHYLSSCVWIVTQTDVRKPLV
jgi:hypothetical protein